MMLLNSLKNKLKFYQLNV